MSPEELAKQKQESADAKAKEAKAGKGAAGGSADEQPTVEQGAAGAENEKKKGIKSQNDTESEEMSSEEVAKLKAELKKALGKFFVGKNASADSQPTVLDSKQIDAMEKAKSMGAPESQNDTESQVVDKIESGLGKNASNTTLNITLNGTDPRAAHIHKKNHTE